MLTKFWEGLGSKLAERWVATVATPAFAFWIGGLIAWYWAHRQEKLTTLLNDRLDSLDEASQWVLVILGLLVVVGSAALVQAFDRSLLRALEGYWWPLVRPLRAGLIKWQSFLISRDESRFQALKKKGIEDLSRKEREEYVRRDLRLSHTPTDAALRMPTRLGNVLRAAETVPEERYGLDAVVCWPRLWLVLPDSAKAEVGQSVAQLETAVRWWFWSILFVVWTIWAWWAAFIGLLLGLLAYRSALNAAETYADLFQAVFDVYRFSLYEELRWPSPTNPSEDQERGRALTKYLWRGSDENSPKFVRKA